LNIGAKAASTGEHPDIVEEKSLAGDWEGDTVEISGKNAYIATFFDRKTKLLLAKLMPDKTTTSLNRATVRAFQDDEAEGLVRKSLALTSAMIWKGGQASKKVIRSRIRGARSFPHRYQLRVLGEQTSRSMPVSYSPLTP
jgi:hypothetical protein